MKSQRTQFDLAAMSGIGFPTIVPLCHVAAPAGNITGRAKFTVPNTLAAAKRGTTVMRLTEIHAYFRSSASGTLTLNVIVKGVTVGSIVLTGTGGDTEILDCRDVNGNGIALAAGDTIQINEANSGSPTTFTDLNVSAVCEVFGVKG